MRTIDVDATALTTAEALALGRQVVEAEAERLLALDRAVLLRQGVPSAAIEAMVEIHRGQLSEHVDRYLAELAEWLSEGDAARHIH